MKNNNHKKRVFQDNFIKNWCCSSHNHPKGWSWWKKHNRKITRLKTKQELSQGLAREGSVNMDEEEYRYCHHDDTDEYHDCLDYMECEECPYYYEDID